jgi:hypothetical protein
MNLIQRFSDRFSEWFAQYTIDAIQEMLYDITTNLFSNTEVITLLLVIFFLWYMVSSLKKGKWLVLGAALFLIASL